MKLRAADRGSLRERERERETAEECGAASGGPDAVGRSGHRLPELEEDRSHADCRCSDIPASGSHSHTDPSYILMTTQLLELIDSRGLC